MKLFLQEPNRRQNSDSPQDSAQPDRASPSCIDSIESHDKQDNSRDAGDQTQDDDHHNFGGGQSIPRATGDVTTTEVMKNPSYRRSAAAVRKRIAGAGLEARKPRTIIDTTTTNHNEATNNHSSGLTASACRLCEPAKFQWAELFGKPCNPSDARPATVLTNATAHSKPRPFRLAPNASLCGCTVVAEYTPAETDRPQRVFPSLLLWVSTTRPCACRCPPTPCDSLPLAASAPRTGGVSSFPANMHSVFARSWRGRRACGVHGVSIARTAWCRPDRARGSGARTWKSHGSKGALPGPSSEPAAGELRRGSP